MGEVIWGDGEWGYADASWRIKRWPHSSFSTDFCASFLSSSVSLISGLRSLVSWHLSSLVTRHFLITTLLWMRSRMRGMVFGEVTPRENRPG